MPDDEIKNQLDGARKLVELAQIRTQQSAERNYQNAERTLSVWMRTALATMIFGIAIDRLGLMLYEIPQHTTIKLTKPDAPSMIFGGILLDFWRMRMIIKNNMPRLLFIMNGRQLSQLLW